MGWTVGSVCRFDDVTCAFFEAFMQATGFVRLAWRDSAGRGVS